MKLPRSLLRKGVIAFAISLPMLVAMVLVLRPSGRNAQTAPATLTILGRTNEAGRQVVTFELHVPTHRRIAIREANLVTDWGTSTAVHGPPQWAGGTDPTGKVFAPGKKVLLSIIEPSQRLRRLQLQTMEFETGLAAWRRKLQLAWQTKRLSMLKTGLPAVSSIGTYVQSGLISTYASDNGPGTDRSLPDAKTGD